MVQTWNIKSKLFYIYDSEANFIGTKGAQYLFKTKMHQIINLNLCNSKFYIDSNNIKD
jgi:hypothetical protein